MSNLIDIQGQIEKLQKQAEDIKAKEFDKTVREMVVTMQAFGITSKDLLSAISSRRKSKVKALAKPVRSKVVKTSGSKVAAKYRGPNGESWSGRGLTPRWLSGLLAQGKKKEDFVVKL